MKTKKNPGPSKSSRLERLKKLAYAASHKFAEAVQKQFPRDKHWRLKMYERFSHNDATKKALAREQKYARAYSDFRRAKENPLKLAKFYVVKAANGKYVIFYKLSHQSMEVDLTSFKQRASYTQNRLTFSHALPLLRKHYGQDFQIVSIEK